jgi:hypothetical protein
MITLFQLKIIFFARKWIISHHLFPVPGISRQYIPSSGTNSVAVVEGVVSASTNDVTVVVALADGTVSFLGSNPHNSSYASWGIAKTKLGGQIQLTYLAKGFGL